MAGVKWTAIILTCHNKDYAEAFQSELKIWQKKGVIDDDVIILTVEDPHSQVGSGGATVNALLVVSEYISARAGHSVINTDLLADARILIFHMGRDFPYDGCGRGFVTLPQSHRSVAADGLVTNLQHLLHTMTNQVAMGSPPGVWVCSTDMLLDIPPSAHVPPVGCGVAVCALAVPGSVQYAADHGVYHITDNGFLEDIIYKGSEDDIRKCCLPDGTVLLVSGVVFFSPLVAERLLMSTLNACTYLGLDSGAHPIQLSLFFDVLLSMCSGVSEEEFVSGSRSGSYGRAMAAGASEQAQQLMCAARRAIWQRLRQTPATTMIIASGRHSYMSMDASVHRNHLIRRASDDCEVWAAHNFTHSYIHPDAKCSQSTVINSVVEVNVQIGRGTVVSHCELTQGLTLGAESIFYGLARQDLTMAADVVFKDDIAVQVFNLACDVGSTKRRVLTLLGCHDNLQIPVKETGSTFLNLSWESFIKRTGITADLLWDTSVDESKRYLLNAQLFPVHSAVEATDFKTILWLQGSGAVDDSMDRWKSSHRLSMEAILKQVDIAAELDWRRLLFFDVANRQVCATLLDCTDRGLVGLYRSAVIEGYALSMLRTLDEVAYRCNSPGITARALANIARLLACLARGHGGLASGPAGNRQWAPALQLLESHQVEAGVRALGVERQRWLSRPSLLVRAARHYMGAAQILVRQAVMTASVFIHLAPCPLPPMGRWVTAECPARIDLAGGWSDLAPITYEQGGAVLNAAILVEGKKPIGAKVRRIERCELHLLMEDVNGDISSLVICELSQLADYNQPQAPGALLKAVLRCTELVDFESRHCSLSDQLAAAYGGGFELCTWSRLPQGSGLGTSSILAGAAIAAVWRAAGHMFDLSSLVHAVMLCEQLLTTGGGWQDAVGGLVGGGVKFTTSAPRLPLRVDVTVPQAVEGATQRLSERLVLVYTGKTRLAKNLLQNVMLDWYSRDPAIMQLQKALVCTAHRARDAFERGDVQEVGACFDAYWAEKKRAAVGCEPREVGVVRQALRPLLLGSSLTGAGGGGFLCLLTRRPHAHAAIADVLARTKGAENMTLLSTGIDMTGITLTVEGEGQVNLKLLEESAF